MRGALAEVSVWIDPPDAGKDPETLLRQCVGEIAGRARCRQEEDARSGGAGAREISS